MIEILIPNNFVNEINYIIKILFNEFLGVETKTTVTNTKDYQIIFDKKKLVINNYFFKKFNNNLDYLKKGNLPEVIFLGQNQFTTEKDIPIIYGNEEIKIENNNIFCGVDIFASSFLMLTRWEEQACGEQDEHSRFPSALSVIQKNNLQYRPVVNEYLDMLWNMLVLLGFKNKRKEQKYNVKLTHDIDWFYKYRDFNKYLRALGGDIIKRRNPLLLLKTTYEYVFSKLKILKDPYYTFEKLMNISEQNKFTSTFFFMASSTNNNDVCYNIFDKKVIETIENIIQRGHNVGLHATYDSYNNKEIFKKEFERLQKITKNVNECRQHFLRFKNPDTWQIYEDLKIENDNNTGFENDIGFKSGVCYSYPVFNIVTRKQLNLRTFPLIIMDSVFIYNKNISKTQFLEKCKFVTEKVKKYKGTMQILWHNNSHVSFFEHKIVNLL